MCKSGKWSRWWHCSDVNKTKFFRPRPRPIPLELNKRIFWCQTGLVLRPTVSDHITATSCNTSLGVHQFIGEVEPAGEHLLAERHDVWRSRKVPGLMVPHHAGRTSTSLNLVHDQVHTCLTSSQVDSCRGGVVYYAIQSCIWGTGIRGLMTGMATLPQGNQELLVVRDKVGRPQVSLGWASSPVVTTTSIIFCFNKHRLTQVYLKNGH